MSRLIDTLLRAKPDPAIYAVLKACTVVAADNVAAYLESVGKFGSFTAALELPYIVPPLKDLFVEHRLGKPIGAVGWYLHTYERDKDGYLPVSAPNVDDGGARWCVRGFMYLEALPQRPHVWCEILVAPSGRLYHVDGKPVGFILPTRNSHFLPLWERSDPPDAEFDWAYAGLVVTLWTLCFMHTKNVSIDTVEPPAKLSKAHQKRGHEPLSAYKVLRITPMGGASRGDTGEGTHASPSLHICRGHWKHYTEATGLLFGKYEGIYWWHQQLRGRREHGTVQKDYEVMPS